MKKLLHERLREHEDKSKCTGYLFADIIGCDKPECVGVACGDCTATLLDKFADEIERYYIPRPRFEDGEPVQFGDDSIECIGIDCFALYPDGSYQVYSENGDYSSEILNEPLKRPQPKVLDADGIEIKVGDTVWKRHCPDEEWTVVEIGNTPVNEGQVRIEFEDFNEEPYSYYESPERLTHKEPDSLEKLHDDVLKWIARYRTSTPYEAVESIGEEIADRLSALIERGA